MAEERTEVQRTIDKSLGSLSADLRRRVLWDKAKKLYEIETPKAGSRKRLQFAGPMAEPWETLLSFHLPCWGIFLERSATTHCSRAILPMPGNFAMALNAFGAGHTKPIGVQRQT